MAYSWSPATVLERPKLFDYNIVEMKGADVEIIEVTGEEAASLVRYWTRVAETMEEGQIKTVRVAVGGREVKFKINEGPWTRGYTSVITGDVVTDGRHEA